MKVIIGKTDAIYEYEKIINNINTKKEEKYNYLIKKK